MYLMGDAGQAQDMAQRAAEHYLSNGAVARAARAWRLAAGWTSPNSAAWGASPADSGTAEVGSYKDQAL